MTVNVVDGFQTQTFQSRFFTTNGLDLKTTHLPETIWRCIITLAGDV